jgi:hypothetical protein
MREAQRAPRDRGSVLRPLTGALELGCTLWGRNELQSRRSSSAAYGRQLALTTVRSRNAWMTDRYRDVELQA